MSSTRTFNPVVPLTNPGTGGAFIYHSSLGFQEAEAFRQCVDSLGYRGGEYDLGGEQYRGIVSASFVPVASYRWYDIDARSLGGFETKVCYVAYTSNGAVPVKIRLYNVTDGASVGDSGDITSTSAVEGSFTVTLAAGAKRYRAEVIGGAADDVFAWGCYLRIQKVPV